MSTTKFDFDLVHSSINFHVRHLMVSKVHGRFQKWTGNLELDEQDLTRSRFDVTANSHRFRICLPPFISFASQ